MSRPSDIVNSELGVLALSDADFRDRFARVLRLYDLLPARVKADIRDAYWRQEHRITKKQEDSDAQAQNDDLSSEEFAMSVLTAVLNSTVRTSDFDADALSKMSRIALLYPEMLLQRVLCDALLSAPRGRILMRVLLKMKPLCVSKLGGESSLLCRLLSQLLDQTPTDIEVEGYDSQDEEEDEEDGFRAMVETMFPHKKKAQKSRGSDHVDATEFVDVVLVSRCAKLSAFEPVEVDTPNKRRRVALQDGTSVTRFHRIQLTRRILRSLKVLLTSLSPKALNDTFYGAESAQRRQVVTHFLTRCVEWQRRRLLTPKTVELALAVRALLRKHTKTAEESEATLVAANNETVQAFRRAAQGQLASLSCFLPLTTERETLAQKTTDMVRALLQDTLFMCTDAECAKLLRACVTCKQGSTVEPRHVATFVAVLNQTFHIAVTGTTNAHFTFFLVLLQRLTEEARLAIPRTFFMSISRSVSRWLATLPHDPQVWAQTLGMCSQLSQHVGMDARAVCWTTLQSRLAQQQQQQQHTAVVD
ncbi:MAG: hypothetical protein MHM6MM_001803 [Cercozoa sp. M6MM]